MKIAGLAVSIGCLLLAQNFVLAAYPERPIRLIIPAPAGGATDVVGRLIGGRLVDQLKQQVVVDNRGGAGGIIGAQIAAKAAADGYTLLMPTSNHAASASLVKLPYDPVDDFTMVSLVADQPGLLVAHPSVPFNTFQEFIAHTRQHADLNYANPGAGTFPGLVMAMLISRAGLKLTSVTYKGAGPAMIDLLSGRVQLKVDSYVTAYPQIKAGRLKLLAVTTANRVELLPDTPTIVEMGFAGSETSFFMGIAGPKRLPEPVRRRLERALIESVKTEDVSRRLSVDGFRPLAATGADLDHLIRREIKLWEKVVRDANIRVN